VLSGQFGIAPCLLGTIVGNRSDKIETIESKVWVLDRERPPDDLTAVRHLLECAGNVRLRDFGRPDAHHDFAQQECPLTAAPKKLSNSLDICQWTYFLTFDRSSAGTSAGSKRIEDASLNLASRFALKSVA